MLLGTKFGTIFIKIFTSQFLTIGVLIVIFYSIISTYKVVIKEREAEALYGNNNENQSNLIEPLISNNDANQNDFNQQVKVLTLDEKSILEEDDNPIKLNLIFFMIILEILSSLINFLKEILI